MRVHRWRDEDYDGFRGFLHLYGGPETFEKNGRTVEIDTEILSGHVEAGTNTFGHFHAYVQVNGEEDVLVSVAIPKLFAVWAGLKVNSWGFNWESRNPLRYLFIRGRPEHAGGSGIHPGILGWPEREFGVYVRNGSVTIDIGTAPHGASSNPTCYRRRYPWEWVRDLRETGEIVRKDRHEYRRKVKHGSLYGRWLRLFGWLPEYGFEIQLKLDPRDLLLGRHTILEETDVTRDRAGRRALTRAEPQEPDGARGPLSISVMIPMPEGDYPAFLRIQRTVRGRKRWPLGRKVGYATDLEVPGGIPFPGKGESSYDCDDDGLYGQSAPGQDVEAAIVKAVSSVLTSRARYGSLSYVPSGGWPDHRRVREEA